MIEIEDATFVRLRDLVYRHSGMYFDQKKMYFFGRRVQARVEAVGATSPSDYAQLLRYGDSAEEIEALCEALTTNETYFFREYPQLKVFAEEVLQTLLERKRAEGSRRIKVWSAACSTGEEPYTLAIILREMIEDFERWDVSVVGSDINQDVLRRARRGVYGERALKDVPTAYREKYFRQESDGEKVLTPISRLVSFRRVNLMSKRPPHDLQDVDVVFCRNVLIYFDDESRRQVVEMIHDSLNPGGVIFLGHSESVGRITSAFRPLHIGGMLVYAKH